MDRYASFEALGIHALTGALFVIISGLLLWQAALHSIVLLLPVVAITALAAWGWALQARFFTSLLRGEDLDYRV